MIKVYVNLRIESIRDIVKRYELMVKDFQKKAIENPSYNVYHDPKFIVVKTIYEEFYKYLKKYELSKK